MSIFSCLNGRTYLAILVESINIPFAPEIFLLASFSTCSVKKPWSIQLQRLANHVIDNSLLYSPWGSVS